MDGALVQLMKSAEMAYRRVPNEEPWGTVAAEFRRMSSSVESHLQLVKEP